MLRGSRGQDPRGAEAEEIDHRWPRDGWPGGVDDGLEEFRLLGVAPVRVSPSPAGTARQAARRASPFYRSACSLLQRNSRCVLHSRADGKGNQVGEDAPGYALAR